MVLLTYSPSGSMIVCFDEKSTNADPNKPLLCVLMNPCYLFLHALFTSINNFLSQQSVITTTVKLLNSSIVGNDLAV